MAQVGDELERLLLMADVEGRGRLVEQQDRRLLGDRARQHDPLPLAAAQRAEEPADERLELQPLDRLRGDPTVFAALRLRSTTTYGVRPSST